jgi:hypothetical protein
MKKVKHLFHHDAKEIMRRMPVHVIGKGFFRDPYNIHFVTQGEMT